MGAETVQCELCPKNCRIAPGQSGECRIRVNLNGKLTAVTYGHPCAIHVDPMEKKPMFHFLPGTSILSLATVGCNLHCKNCQNWEISQQNPELVEADTLLPQDIPKLANQFNCKSVAYTYTDPVVYYEYALDGCIATREAGLKNVLVTAGYANKEPWQRLCACADGANIDLKSISDRFYREVCEATLAPIQRALIDAKSAGVIVEVTNLVIPTLNDGDDEITGLCRWIVENLGKETPLHFSRFHPAYRMLHLPPTPESTLTRAREIAKAEGLFFVYVGNIEITHGSDTFCPKCNELLIERRIFTVLQNKIREGKCPKCGERIYGQWN
ncbi:MAG TPA: AmmeMemoRadiSam system radical SAM enzyme [Candidatus Hydrogenedentes bacterium]|nr:AmmeMemoRadiSam system radical SAM enzyme [Candidatus Hydrogenedentota bacterium]HOL75681.1 AmmeMemoRadiSam system radical SAM enzyme [Candidatus Hydrogenedentota bacterium]HPO84326.1 AmmeMemoRadiSam system radical SAM enzyme [Candidatus Hydrogenedentota bacterium]